MAITLRGPLLFVVLDGVGEVAREQGNAVRLAPTPQWDRLRAENRFTTLRAHGRAVGLPSDDDMGNSEVGHNALGSGQVYDQGAKLVEDAVASGRIWESEHWARITERSRQELALAPGSTVHAMVKAVAIDSHSFGRSTPRRPFPTSPGET